MIALLITTYGYPITLITLITLRSDDELPAFPEDKVSREDEQEKEEELPPLPVTPVTPVTPVDEARTEPTGNGNFKSRFNFSKLTASASNLKAKTIGLASTAKVYICLGPISRNSESPKVRKSDNPTARI